MPKDKTESHEKIIAAAYDEFLHYGFKDASMRRIAKSCGMSASGLYKHFSSKEDMFAALVAPAYDDLINAFYSSMDMDYENLDDTSIYTAWAGNDEIIWIIEYIYQHFNAFKLLVCHSQGTRYENYVHDIAVLEEESTKRYFSKARELNASIRMIPDNEYHLFVTTSINAIFQVVEHDFSEEDAISYAKHLNTFYISGWKSLLLPEQNA
ncbi:MAG: TetR/AcrR family transcriptional regulator [Lachnospiraceae bacterium]|nr:TetR/AcrR family transcriptional regulator [Lachnospiraceae bacterium]